MMPTRCMLSLCEPHLPAFLSRTESFFVLAHCKRIWLSAVVTMNDFSAMNDDNKGGENSIEIVATRIKERALELASERARVELAKAELSELQQLLDEETKTNGAIRRTMLSTVRSRHGVEMELWKVRDQQEERFAKLGEYQRETDEANAEMAELRTAWGDAVRDLYVEHDLQRELYRRSVEGGIKRREQRIKERDQRLLQLVDETKVFQEETKRMVEETKKLEKNILDMDNREGKEDEEVAALSMNIRNTIAKVRQDCMSFCCCFVSFIWLNVLFFGDRELLYDEPYAMLRKLSSKPIQR